VAQKYRKIDPRIWTDEGFSRLDREGKLLAFWMLTSTRLNRCGIVLWSPALASEETGIPRDRVERVYDTVCDTVSWVRDRASNTVFLGRWWRYNRPANLSALKGVLSDLHDLPRNALKPALERAAVDLPKSFHTVYHTVLDTVYDTVSSQEQEQEQEQEQDNTPPSEESPESSEDARSGAAAGPPVLSFPCEGKGKTEWHLTAPKLAEYEAAFPALDVLAALRVALQWCRDNRKKTYSGMARFCTNWLSRAQNRGENLKQPRESGHGRNPGGGGVRPVARVQCEPGRYGNKPAIVAGGGASPAAGPPDEVAAGEAP
jgi:hypothetical protein